MIVFRPFDNNNDDKKQTIIFKMSDYDLDIHQREAKFKDYLILCEKCNQKFFNRCYQCDNCLYKEFL